MLREPRVGVFNDILSVVLDLVAHYIGKHQYNREKLIETQCWRSHVNRYLGT